MVKKVENKFEEVNEKIATLYDAIEGLDVSLREVLLEHEDGPDHDSWEVVQSKLVELTELHIWFEEKWPEYVDWKESNFENPLLVEE